MYHFGTTGIQDRERTYHCQQLGGAAALRDVPNDGRVYMGRDGLGIRAAQERLVAIEEITQRQIANCGEPEPALDMERKKILRFLIDEEELI